jgi:hypothetical protein
MRNKGKTFPIPYSRVKDAAFSEAAIKAMNWPKRRVTHLFL